MKVLTLPETKVQVPITMKGKQVWIGDSCVKVPDIECSNGILHGVTVVINENTGKPLRFDPSEMLAGSTVRASALAGSAATAAANPARERRP